MKRIFIFLILFSSLISQAQRSVLAADSGSMLTPYLRASVAAATYEPAIAAGSTAQYWRGDKTWQTLNAIAIGLGNVDNTSDAAKPVSTATQTALDLKANLNSPTIVTPSITTGFTIGGAAATGKFIVGNGTNYVASTSTIPTSAGSTANKILLSDGTNYALSTPTFPNASATSGKIIKSDGTNWVASTETYAAPGTSGNLLVSDGTNWTSAARFPQQVATADIAATASATSTTTLYTPTADGMYRICVYMKITTTGTSPVAGPITITYTDADGSVAQSHTMLLQSTTGTVVTTTVNNSTTTGTVMGSMIVNAKNAVAIQYAIAVSGTFGSGRYTAHFTCERVK